MALETMYEGLPFSPQTTLTNAISEAETVIPVADVSVFPDAPNYATIAGNDGDGETILYTAKTASALSGCTRGVEGVAKRWDSGEIISRNWTAKDHNVLIANLIALDHLLTIILEGIPTALADLTEDATHRLVTDSEKSAWNSKSNFSGAYDDLTGKPTIPVRLSQLLEDSGHRVVTDEEKTKWNEKADTSYVDEKIDEVTGGLTTLYGTVFVSDQYGSRLIPINCENGDGTFKAEFELRNGVLYLKNDLTILLTDPGSAVMAYSFKIMLDDGGPHTFLVGAYSNYVATLLVHQSTGSYNIISESRIAFSAPNTTDGVFSFDGATANGYANGYKLIMLRGFWGVLTD